MPSYIQGMQINFFGTDDDIVQVWRWLFEVTDMKIFESYSKPDEPIRMFESWATIESSLREKSAHLIAWPKSVGGEPQWEKITMERAKPWHLRGKVRTILHSPALIGVHRNNDQRGCLAVAYIKCWNEKGARQRSILPEKFVDEVDWKEFRSIVGKIRRKQLKASPAKLGTAPIMSDAFEKLRAGEIKLWNFGGGEVTFPSTDIALL
jgi:hypothetical protein